MGKKTRTTEKKTYTRNGVTRAAVTALAFLIQFLWIFFLFRWIGRSYAPIAFAMQVIAIILALVIYGKEMNAAIKMPWLIIIAGFPVFGLSLYLFAGLSGSTQNMRKRFEAIDQILFQAIPQNEEIMNSLREKDSDAYSQAYYISNFTKFPIYTNNRIEYYDSGFKGLKAQLEALKKAEKYIFMEYHAIEDSTAFHEIEEILAEKAANGVEVRIFYDDIGSIGFINLDFTKRMEEKGIQCRCFNPVIPVVNFFFNNRDHRKITVIDGKVGFTGGYNLADEYFGYTEPYGVWKDTGIKIEGEAVKSFTMMFLEMWNAIRATDSDDKDFDYFFPDVEKQPSKGFVAPYADSPLDKEHTGENVYLNIINSATKYVYFITPYLIITGEMDKCLRLAAKKGVDVRIITPGIPDKKLVYRITRSYYGSLVKNGVRIYEYTPGFSHAKMCVCDDKFATCGTINLDYRSLYHHFENGTWMYDTDTVMDIKKDFIELFPQCREVTEEYKLKQKKGVDLIQSTLRLFAPLL
ncbi:MAG: cardiolipin synthase [Butyrivibrio sp.]|nr:cardiolipin synthase [Butyrivibrio sp.]